MDQSYKYRASCKLPASRRPELLRRIKTPAVRTTAGVFFVCGGCVEIGLRLPCAHSTNGGVFGGK